MGSSSSRISKNQYKQFVLLTETSMEESTLGQTLAHAIFEIDIYYVHTNANRDTMITVLDSIVEVLEEDKYRVKGLLKEIRAKTSNQLKADLNGVVYAATKEYAKQNGVSFPDLLWEWSWALKTISQALKDDTFDGDECDPVSSDEEDQDADENFGEDDEDDEDVEDAGEGGEVAQEDDRTQRGR